MNARKGEQGNVFIYLFIAVALLGGLAYAVSQNSRSSMDGLTEERQRLIATEIVSFADTISKSVTQLRLRGTSLTELSFASSFLPDADYGTFNSDPANEVFNPRGGAVAYKEPLDGATVGGIQDFAFLASNEIQNVGRTCGATACSDLILILPNVRQEICTRINTLLGVDNPGGNPPVDSDVHEAGTFQAGPTPFSYQETIGDEDTALVGINEACFTETGEDPDEFVYYKVLIPQ